MPCSTPGYVRDEYHRCRHCRCCIAPRVASRCCASGAIPIGIIGAAIILFTVVVALAAPLVAPFPPADQRARRLLPPSNAHLMGTDELGRDTFSRIIYGAQVSLQVGMIAVLIALVLGTFLGVVAGFFGGRVDTWLMRVVDVLFAFPGLILAIVIAGLLGPSRQNAMIAIGVVYAPAFARVIRGSVLSVMSEPYLEAGRVLGAGNFWLIRRYVLPNIVAPLIVLTTVYLSTAILSEAALSFLGLGAQPPEPSWGRDAEYRPHVHGDLAVDGDLSGAGDHARRAWFQFSR